MEEVNDIVLGCPFCGKSPKILKDKKDLWFIACINFDCQAQVKVIDGFKSNAITAWNTRK